MTTEHNGNSLFCNMYEVNAKTMLQHQSETLFNLFAILLQSPPAPTFCTRSHTLNLFEEKRKTKAVANGDIHHSNEKY